MASLKDLRARAQDLLDKMANDPERPFWQRETVSIVLGILMFISVIDRKACKTDKDYAELLQTVNRLEERYAELQYKFAELKERV